MYFRTVKIILALILFCGVLNIYAQENDSLAIGYSYINSFPQNSMVLMHDTLLGYTPLHFMLKNDNPNSEIIIKRNGYADFVIKTGGYEKINKTISMVPVKPGLLIKNPVREDNAIFFNKPRKVIPVLLTSILTAGAGIVSYYFKKLANDNLDSYNNSGDPAALDRKKKYDLISGVSIGAFQLSFAGLIYFLFIDK